MGMLCAKIWPARQSSDIRAGNKVDVARPVEGVEDNKVESSRLFGRSGSGCNSSEVEWGLVSLRF